MYRVYLADYFLRQAKRLLKKFRHLQTDVTLALENFTSASATTLGQNLYKVRIRSQDLAKGKSGSFRAIIFLVETKGLIIPIALYVKNEQGTISEKEIENHFGLILEEIQKKGIID